MLLRTTPEDGDIVVREEKRGGTQVYVLHTAPRADQYEFLSREEGIAQAVALAKRERVRAWLTNEGYASCFLKTSERGFALTRHCGVALRGNRDGEISAPKGARRDRNCCRPLIEGAPESVRTSNRPRYRPSRL
jgi:hypothetical protein